MGSGYAFASVLQSGRGLLFPFGGVGAGRWIYALSGFTDSGIPPMCFTRFSNGDEERREHTCGKQLSASRGCGRWWMRFLSFQLRNIDFRMSFRRMRANNYVSSTSDTAGDLLVSDRFAYSNRPDRFAFPQIYLRMSLRISRYIHPI